MTDTWLVRVTSAWETHSGTVVDVDQYAVDRYRVATNGALELLVEDKPVVVFAPGIWRRIEWLDNEGRPKAMIG